MRPIAALRLALLNARRRAAVARRVRVILAGDDHTLREEIEEWAAEAGDRPALRGPGERLSYRDLFGEANRWARWAILHGVGPDDRVALIMADRPGRVAAWIGIAMAGGVAVLFDDGLEGETLASAIAEAAPRLLVVDAACLQHFETAATRLAITVSVWVHGPHPMAYMRIDEALADLAPDRLARRDRRPLVRRAEALRLVVSTSEGIAVTRLDHHRLLESLTTIAAALGATRDDRWALPAGGGLDEISALAPLAALSAGGIGVIVDRRDPARLAQRLGDDHATILVADADLCRRLPTREPATGTPTPLRAILAPPSPDPARDALFERFEAAERLEISSPADGSPLAWRLVPARRSR